MNLNKDFSGNFEIFQDRMDREIHQTAQSFVRIGYLLKVARDTNILARSGYKDVNEYAKTRYGLSRDLVSRYMAINDRFSEGGYSENLVEKHRGIGMTKLAEMLTMSDEVIAAIPSGTTREEIREIKAEIAEEEKITDIEVALEQPLPEERTILQEVLFLYFQEIPERYPVAHIQVNQPESDGLLEVFAPTGQGVKIVRVPGKGKLMLSFDGQDPITLVNLRTDETLTYTWEKFALELRALCPISMLPEKAWEALYGQPFLRKEPEKAKRVEVVKSKAKPEKMEQRLEKVSQKQEKRERQPEKPKTEKAEEHSKIQPSEKSGMKSSEKLEESGISEQLALEPKLESGTNEPEEIAPAQEWLNDLRTCYEKALKAAEEGRWDAWDGHMIQAKTIANVIRKAQEDKEIPGQMTIGGINE